MRLRHTQQKNKCLFDVSKSLRGKERLWSKMLMELMKKQMNFIDTDRARLGKSALVARPPVT